MKDYTLYFENSRSQRRVLATYNNIKNENDALQDALRKIKEFCNERDYIIPYSRLWNSDGETVFDVGSHTEFFYLSPEVHINGGE